MVSSSLQKAVGQLSLAEKVELRDFIDLSIGWSDDAPALSEEQRATVRRRAADLDVDPSIGVPWEDANAELAAEFG
ncbi:MAG: addiction module protein [Bifidobacteriaceae bacterium]|jgi:putative addiction module component (TIGR02574 family)|nr:addiction module protein [Bifidobacteriaceae bacterium]